MRRTTAVAAALLVLLSSVAGQACRNNTHAVSRIGIGTYRFEIESHGPALRKALAAGINLIDTSANYGDGRSEEIIGQVVREMVAAGQLNRDDVTIVSKFGYIQGQNHQRLQGGFETADTVHIIDGELAHCVHPDFMRDQLRRSLERLGMDRLEVFLLHNPEYYMQSVLGEGRQGGGGDEDEDDEEDGAPPEPTAAAVAAARVEMMRRIELAFEALEMEVQGVGGGLKRIDSYGMGSTGGVGTCSGRCAARAVSPPSTREQEVLRPRLLRNAARQ